MIVKLNLFQLLNFFREKFLDPETSLPDGKAGSE